MNRRRRCRSQHGFTLLLVFALAAAAACLLYLEMPRLAFESQRGKEELLIDRGEQFIRAIKVFRTEVRKQPATLDELESFNNRRFLRRRYRDPMTGTDEWRLIHSDPNGLLVDSLGQNSLDKNKQSSDPGVLGARIQGVGDSATASGPDAQGTNNPGLVRRASDRVIPGGPGAPSQPDPADPQQQQSQPPVPGVPINNGLPVQPGQQPGQPGQQPGQPGQTGQPGTPGSAFGGSSAFGSSNPAPPPLPGQPQSPFQNQVPGGSQPGQPNNQAINLIQQSLMAPRPVGSPGGIGGNGSSPGGGTVFGAGIAGVASKKDADAIKIYKDQTNYKVWEFVFDPRAEAQKQQQQMRAQQQSLNPNAPKPPGQN